MGNKLGKKELPKKVAIICVGNICRSPVGEALLREYTEQSSCSFIHNIQFDSAGLFGGRLQIAEDSLDFLHKRGISTDDFQSKKTTREFFDKNDLIIVMENYMKEFIITHYYPLLQHSEQKKILKRIYTLHEVAGASGEISDPYHTSSKNFLRVLQSIDGACQKIIKRWESSTKSQKFWQRFGDKIKSLFQ